MSAQHSGLLEPMPQLLERAGFRVRGNRADCSKCAGGSRLTVSFNSQVGHCFRCGWKANQVTLSRELGLLVSSPPVLEFLKRERERRERTLSAKRACKGGLSSGEGVVSHLRDPTDNDPGVSDKRLIAYESEFSSALRAMGRDGNTLSAQLRQAWDSGELRILTRNFPLQATNSHLSLISHITKQELLRYLNTTECANGFGNRILWAWVERSKILPEGGNLQPEALCNVVGQVRAALEFARFPQEIKRDQEAREMWQAAYRALTADRSGLLGSILARSEAQTMRLALIYALLDRSPWIQRRHLEAALAVMDFVTASAGWIFGELYGDPVADKILAALRESLAGLTRIDRTTKEEKQVRAAKFCSRSQHMRIRASAAEIGPRAH